MPRQQRADERSSTASRRVPPDEIPRRAFGRTGQQVSVLGIGGYHLGNVKSKHTAIRLVHAAIDGGISFMDSPDELAG